MHDGGCFRTTWPIKFCKKVHLHMKRHCRYLASLWQPCSQLHVHEFLAKQKEAMLLQPPYSPSRQWKATLNLHTHAWIFSCLSIVSVDGKQHLHEIVFSALLRFSLQGKWQFPGCTHAGYNCLWSPAWPVRLVTSPECTETAQKP